MKTSGIHKWLEKGYQDDGVTRYMCLNCKDSWDARTEACYFSFCPYCGVKFIGEHEKAPRRFEKTYDYPRARTQRLRGLAKFVIIERFFCCTKGVAEEPMDWTLESSYAHEEAASAFRRLKSLRDSQAEDNEEDNSNDWLGYYEYRAVPVKHLPENLRGSMY